VGGSDRCCVAGLDPLDGDAGRLGLGETASGERLPKRSDPKSGGAAPRPSFGDTSAVRVLVREEIAPAGLELLRQRFEVDEDGDSDLARIIDRYDAIVIRSATKLTADLIAKGTKLKVIGRAGVGVDNVDVDAATRQGIVVANAPDSNVVSAAEHTVGLLVALARNIPQAHAALVDGRWERSKWGGVELAEKTLGILGFGRIGQQVARRGVGLQMRVVAYDPFVSADRFRELGVESDTLENVIARADFLTLHLPLNDETRGVIDAKAIARMKEGVRIVNAARGELVDEEALGEGLRSGKVAGAALDVFPQEPYSGPLLGAPNIIVTPHLAASTDEAQDRAGVIVAEQVAAALDGGLVTNAVNIPSLRAEDLEVLGPFVPLAAALGRLALELARGEPVKIGLEYYGELSEHDTRLLTLAALNGAFRGRVEQPVNYVNAPLVAAERGIDVVEERRRSSRDFTNLIAVTAGDARVAGTTIGRDHRQWLVSAWDFELEIELAPRMIFLTYDDVPGVIGRVGTTLGEAGVNIANMAVSRNREGGKALMALSIDTPAAPEVIERLRQGVDDAYLVTV
jgi:D-3-phosphoglycerate dehydrogenase